MGLTGVILDAVISLKRICSKHVIQKTVKTGNLQETFEAFEEYKEIPYSVAWIDCLAKNRNLGKCLLMTGDFSDDGELNYSSAKKMNIPFNFPQFVL
ncbi:MAG: FAD-binding protein, partial [Candidatus Electrothrix sp. LOE1_4_5]|nr:FAD-binding protein [Candidatus Electrothrix gigas]